jgi:hypothetical protein
VNAQQSEVEDASVFRAARCQAASAPLWLNLEAAAFTRRHRNIGKPCQLNITIA